MRSWLCRIFGFAVMFRSVRIWMATDRNGVHFQRHVATRHTTEQKANISWADIGLLSISARPWFSIKFPFARDASSSSA